MGCLCVLKSPAWGSCRRCRAYAAARAESCAGGSRHERLGCNTAPTRGFQAVHSIVFRIMSLFALHPQLDMASADPPATAHETLGFELGWDHARYGVVPSLARAFEASRLRCAAAGPRVMSQNSRGDAFGRALAAPAIAGVGARPEGRAGASHAALSGATRSPPLSDYTHAPGCEQSAQPRSGVRPGAPRRRLCRRQHRCSERQG